ncbi:MAG: glycosyltransferase [Candidatus Gastranaerophilales bacterium]|nr:glycosyltransferase [Candidatus Gastranaerophilales bacterium]
MQKFNKKPKIAIIHPAFGASLGGSQVFVKELVNELKDKCEIKILSSGKNFDEYSKFCKPVKSIIRRTYPKHGKFIYGLFLNVLRKYSNSPDIVIEHLTSFFPVLYNLLTNDYDIIYPNNDWGGLLTASIARKIKKTPILFTEHCGFMDGGKILDRNLKFYPDKYITLSQELKYYVRKHYNYIDVEYIPNGVNLERFNPDIVPVEIDLQKPIFLATGRYYENKRLELVIEAVSRLDCGSLLLLSDGNNIEKLENLGIEKLGKKRFKLKKVSYLQMPSYYKVCDVFTLPSENEPFGLVYLEAMACNKPVVAPNDVDRQLIIGNGGILCNVKNVDEYANTLKNALEKNWQNKPFSQAQKFSWKNSAQKYFSVIQEMTDKVVFV